MATLAGAGAAIIAACTILIPFPKSFLGLSDDFWRGFPIGLAIGLAVVAIAAAIKSKAEQRKAP